MDSVVAFSKDLFAFDAYWKVVLLIFFFGTICAYVFTRSLKDTTTKYYLQKGTDVPAWRGFLLTCFSSLVGGIVGVMLDLSILPIVAKAGVCEPCAGDVAAIIVPHYTLLSVLCGVGAGVLSSFSFPFIRSKLARWTKKDSDSKGESKSGGVNAPDLGRETFSWTAGLDRKEILEKLAEEGERRKAEKAVADELRKAESLARAAKLDEEKAKLERELAEIAAAKAELKSQDGDEDENAE